MRHLIRPMITVLIIHPTLRCPPVANSICLFNPCPTLAFLHHLLRVARCILPRPLIDRIQMTQIIVLVTPQVAYRSMETKRRLHRQCHQLKRPRVLVPNRALRNHRGRRVQGL